MRRLTAAFLVVLLPLILIAASTQIDWTQLKNKPTSFQADWNSTVINRPTLATVATSGAYTDLSGRPSLWNDPGSGTLLKRTGAFTFAAAVSNTDYQAALGFTPENSANKGAVSGYAGLNSSSIVPTANLPACVASGASHAAGLVPDPGASAGTTKFLREDCTFVVPTVSAYALPFNSASVTLSGTQYFGTSGNTPTPADWALPMALAGTASTFYALLSAALPGGVSEVLTFQKNGVDTVLTCTVAATTNSCNDLTHSFTFAAADTLLLKSVTSGGTSGNFVKTTIKVGP